MTLRRSSEESLLIIEYVSEALRAIHVVTPHHTAKWHAYHMQQPTVPG